MKVLLHTIRESEISNYLRTLLYEIEEGADTAKASFDHGDYEHHLKQLSCHLFSQLYCQLSKQYFHDYILHF